MNDHHHPSTDAATRFDTLRKDMADGLRFTHNQATANTRKLLEVASFAYAAIDLLAEKGLLQIEDLDERQKTVAASLVEKFIDQGMASPIRKRNKINMPLSRCKLIARSGCIFAKQPVAA